MADETDKINIAFKLNDTLTKYINELKEYHQVLNNTDMIRSCITIAYREMLKEKKELGLSDKLFSD